MRLLITGASGLLGAYLLREWFDADTVCAWSGTRVESRFGITTEPVNLANADQVAAAFRRARPTAVIHSAAVATVAACHRDPAFAREINVHGSAQLVELAAEAGARLVLVSTDMVFDGARGWYTERDAPAPLSEYGRTKLAAERAVLAAPRGMVARVSLLFGPTLTGRPAFFDEQVQALRGGKPLRSFTDEWRTPLSLPAAARAVLALARGEGTGILHLGGPERLSRLEFAQKLAGVLGIDPGLLVPTLRADFPAPEPRPRDVSLDSSRWGEVCPGRYWPGVEEALRDMMAAH